MTKMKKYRLYRLEKVLNSGPKQGPVRTLVEFTEIVIICIQQYLHVSAPSSIELICPRMCPQLSILTKSMQCFYVQRYMSRYSYSSLLKHLCVESFINLKEGFNKKCHGIFHTHHTHTPHTRVLTDTINFKIYYMMLFDILYL